MRDPATISLETLETRARQAAEADAQHRAAARAGAVSLRA